MENARRKNHDLVLGASSAVRELSTVRDFVRFAVSKFKRAGLCYGHGTSNPFDEAVFLVLEGLKLPIGQLPIEPLPIEHLEHYYDAKLLPEEKEYLAGLIEARVTTRKPLAYLLNKTYLQGVPFYVDERVIVPRSYLADFLFRDVTDDEGVPLIEDPSKIERVLDLCTGSGCLAILAATVFQGVEIDAVDLSPEALEVAKINVEQRGLDDRVTLFEGDLFKPLKGQKYDFIITNPPYVDEQGMTDLQQEYLHEPRMALESGKDGLDIVRRILKEASTYLKPEGRLVCEVGTNGRRLLTEEYPGIPFLWLETENSKGEVFWLTRDQLSVRSPHSRRMSEVRPSAVERTRKQSLSR